MTIFTFFSSVSLIPKDPARGDRIIHTQNMAYFELRTYWKIRNAILSNFFFEGRGEKWICPLILGTEEGHRDGQARKITSYSNSESPKMWQVTYHMISWIFLYVAFTSGNVEGGPARWTRDIISIFKFTAVNFFEFTRLLGLTLIFEEAELLFRLPKYILSDNSCNFSNIYKKWDSFRFFNYKNWLKIPPFHHPTLVLEAIQFRQVVFSKLLKREKLF